MELQSEKIDILVSALIKVQSEVDHVGKDSTNPHFKNSYASLTAVIAATREVLTKYNMCVAQQGYAENGQYFLMTQLTHLSGQWIRSFYPLAMDPNPQKVGSAFSYARRYALKAILNLSEDDDDAQQTAAHNVRPIAPPQRAPVSYDQKKELSEKNQGGPISTKQLNLLRFRMKNVGLKDGDVLAMCETWNPHIKSLSQINWGWFDELLSQVGGQ